MKTTTPVVALVLGLAGAADATVFGPGSGGAIPDATVNFQPGVPLTSTINVASAGNVASVNWVTLTGLTHTWVGDLVVTLTAPNGENVHLIARVGATTPTSFGSDSDVGGDYSFTNTGSSFLAAAATTPVPPDTYRRSTTGGGTVPPADGDDFSVFNGDPVNGNWTLTITDWGIQDVGSLVSWSMSVEAAPNCPGNIVNTGTSANKVDVDDLLLVISSWGPCPAPPVPCPANIATSGTSANKVDVDDLLLIIGSWGPCPVSVACEDIRDRIPGSVNHPANVQSNYDAINRTNFIMGNTTVIQFATMTPAQMLAGHLASVNALAQSGCVSINAPAVSSALMDIANLATQAGDPTWFEILTLAPGGAGNPLLQQLQDRVQDLRNLGIVVFDAPANQAEADDHAAALVILQTLAPNMTFFRWLWGPDPYTSQERQALMMSSALGMCDSAKIENGYCCTLAGTVRKCQGGAATDFCAIRRNNVDDCTDNSDCCTPPPAMNGTPGACP